MTLLLKCEGLDDAHRKARPVATSLLSLHGLAAAHGRGRTELVSAGADARIRPRRRSGTTRPIDDSDLVPLDDADWEADLAAWHAECDLVELPLPLVTSTTRGYVAVEPCSLRWIYVHMIEEYARHNGHADLIRELIDGAVGG